MMMPQRSAQESLATRYEPWQWVTVILLSALAGALVTQVSLTTTKADAQAVSSAQAPAPREGVFAMAGQLSRDNYGIFLVDSANSTMAVYEWAPGAQGRKLHLVAARNFSFDLQLDDYNNAEPLPRDVQALVRQNNRLKSGATSKP
jgi:hypothetical protein